MDPLLSVQISVDYPTKPRTLQNVAFEMAEGEALGLAGDSGSGKSTLALSILRLIELRHGHVTGSIRFAGRDLLRLSERDLRSVRGREISLVMQNPASALNPMLRLETQLREAWSTHANARWRMVRPGVQDLLVRMGLPGDDSFLSRYPGQISIGQAQRVVIAMAMLHRPKLIIADEPTSALDSSSRAGVLDLLASLNGEEGTAILYISHDLASTEQLCDRVLTLKEGTLVNESRRPVMVC
jgi:ABC-type glutathione transport system ATPase component